MFSAFANCLKIPELRQRIFFTLALIFVARVGAHIPLPGIDPAPLQEFFRQQAGSAAGAVMGLYNMFTGGALLKGAICAMGIMPNVSASIIMQLMVAVVPQLARLQQEGDVGRQKVQQYTRYFTVVICIVQGMLLLGALENPSRLFAGFEEAKYGSIVIASKGWFMVTSIIFLTAGTLLMMWLGEQITQRGIGNGISILITIGILADIPGAAVQTWQMFFAPVGTGQTFGLIHAAVMIALFFGVTAFIVAITQAQRKIPVQYAKRVIGQRVYGGQSSFLPLKINYSGVMPVIFASAILLFPQMIMQFAGAKFNLPFLLDLAGKLQSGKWFYYVLDAGLILFFSYFWVSVMFKPIQIADDLKKYGGYIPGVRPGEPTAKFLDFIMTRLTLFGAIALTFIAVMPDFLYQRMGLPQRISYFFGGTGMLITVGVMLDTMRQLETFLLQRHYDGFLKKGRLRSRSTALPGFSDGAEVRNIQPLLLSCGAILTVGLVAWAIRGDLVGWVMSLFS
ncbi:MAG: preprotein translocase subunit SecY [Opitutaceae bacterium]|nr:preprotein translocase subunit SecY [Opitutaceae bacterium]